MGSKTAQGRPHHPALEASLTLVAMILGGVLGGACAAYAGRIATARIWDESQAPLAATWCLASYAGASLLWSVFWSSCLRSQGEPGEWNWAFLLVFHIVGCLLAYPFAFVGSYVGKLVGAVAGVFTAPFGHTWLDDALATSGKGCVIGAAVGVALPWLLLLKMLDITDCSPTPPSATNATMTRDNEDTLD